MRIVSDVDMEAFWDERARENAAYFVDNQLDYADPDLDAFWAGGEDVVARFEHVLGFAVGATDDVVEIGCGMGRLTRALKARAASVRALDVSSEMLDRARAGNRDLAGVEWLHGDGRTITGVADASADGVFSHVVFQHIPDPRVTYGYVAEMGRVLRPGGWAAFHVSNDPSIHRPQSGRRALAHRALALAGRRPKGSTHAAWLGSAVDLGTLRTTAADAGLDVERVVGEGTQYCIVLLRRR
jgi:ubiquinone/menaquinone biosynthesis C-methylase UbiE